MGSIYAVDGLGYHDIFWLDTNSGGPYYVGTILDGLDGATGATGATGPTGGKPAIVRLGGKWRALYCIESPEVVFVEFMSHAASGEERSVAVDPTFVEACEPGTLRLVSVSSDDFGRGWVGGRVVDCRVEFSRSLGCGEILNMMVMGTRRGFAGVRFTESTEEEARRNMAKWA